MGAVLDVGAWLRAQDAPDATVAPPVGVSPLTIAGCGIYQAGRIWKYRGITAFRAPELYARGEHGWLDDYYGAAARLGANTLRMFCMWNNTKYWPHSRPDYYDQLYDCCAHARAAGFYVHLVCFCDQVDHSDILLSRDDQDEHMDQCLLLAHETDHVLIEIENESFKNGENASADRFPSSLFTGLLAMRSSWADGEDPSLGGWLSLCTKHLDRTFDWPRKGKTLYEAQYEGLGEFDAAGVPALSGEPQRIGEGTTPRQHADNAAVCELMGTGGLLHGGFSSFDPSHDNDLQNCKFTGTPESLAAAEAVGAVWKSTTLDPRCGIETHLVRGTECNEGECMVVHYDRYNDASPCNQPDTGATRTYFKVLDGGALACGLSVDPAPRWPGYELRHGWRVADQGGFEGNLLRLTR